MRRLIFFLAEAGAALTATAQQFVLINDEAIRADDIREIRFVEDPDFKLLPDVMAADPKATLFSQALQLTGMADSLQAYYDYAYAEYVDLDSWNWRGDEFYVNDHYQYAQWLRRRYFKFTAFVETDEVLAAHGITTLDGLRAYAKQVYDEVYPEDAAVSDPTDRRHSLNRFVSYHLLPFGATRETLTAQPHYFRQDIADVADWYQTLMPCGSLKVSRPRTGNNPATEIGLFLNRRGLQDGPDRYGMQVRGAEIGEAVETANGNYFYIDDLLVYDKKTQTQTLQERWRVDFVTLSPDFMTAGTRANVAWQGEAAESSTLPAIGFVSDYTNGMEWNEVSEQGYVDLFIAPSRFHYWNYGGDEIDVRDDMNSMDVTVELPALPEGEWEVRFGTCLTPDGNTFRCTMDDDQLRQNLNLSATDFADLGWDAKNGAWYSDPQHAQWLQQNRSRIDELLLTLPTHVRCPTGITYNEQKGVYESDLGFVMDEVMEEIATNYRSLSELEKLIREKVFVPVDDTHVQDVLTGANYAVDETLPDYTQAFTRELLRLNGWMYGPTDYVIATSPTPSQEGWQQGEYLNMYDIERLSRYIIGRFHSDGKSRHRLQIRSCYGVRPKTLGLDYLEFCPVSIADHPSIPEE